MWKRYNKSKIKNFKDEDSYFFEEEEPSSNSKVPNEEEIDPLDAFMAENDKETLKDMHHSIIENKKVMKIPLSKNDAQTKLSKNEEKILEPEEPITAYLQKLKEKRDKIPASQQDFLDEHGYYYFFIFSNIDEDAIREMKKKKNNLKIDEMDHSKIDYEKVKKDFYIENEEIANMSLATVQDIR